MERERLASLLLCDDCGTEAGHGSPDIGHGLLVNARVKIEDPRYLQLLAECLHKIPKDGHPIRLRTEVRLRRRGILPGVVGLTKFSVEAYAPRGIAIEPSGAHTVTFYSSLLEKLSDKAVMAVMAHELAHAWLNEHVRPEASKLREEDADMLVQMWGLESELEALEAETDPIDRV